MMKPDTTYLTRCIELAEEALAAGDDPFGSVLVAADGTVLREARNRARTQDPTQHPEFELARWAAQNMDESARGKATVYTSGEHCPMCSAAHAWAGLGRIVFASSSAQLSDWMAEFGAQPPIAMLGIRQVAPNIDTTGPFDRLATQARALHRKRFAG